MSYGEWIPVSEREPTEEDYKRGDGWVICAFEDGTVRRGYKSHCAKRWFSEMPNNKVTHWMPFPLPPKVSIDDILAFAEEYRKETGVYLGFAKAREEMKRRGYPV